MEQLKPQPNKSAEKFLTLLAEVQSMFNDSVKKDEFVVFTKALMDSVKETHKKMLENVAKNGTKVDANETLVKEEVARMDKMCSDFTATLSKEIGAKLENALKQINAEVNRQIADVRTEIPTIHDLSDRFEEIEAKIPVLPPEKLGEDYRNALEALPEGDKLAIEAIENLREELNAIRAMKATETHTVRTVGRDIIQNYDLSPYLDGVTKTFEIPTSWSIIGVVTSSFPNALRPVIDYTNDNNHITFTSEIDAGTTLAEGQTVILTLVTFF